MKLILISIGTLCVLAVSSCVGQQLNRDTSTDLRTPDVLPHCTEDRRPSYAVMEMAPISNAGNAPQAYLEALYQMIKKHVEKRAVWQVVPASDSIEDVVVFNIAMLSWKDDPDAPHHKRLMEMKLSLIDKFLDCEVSETTGQGQVLVDSSGHGIENGVAEVADGAGWFVENVLVHNQYN